MSANHSLEPDRLLVLKFRTTFLALCRGVWGAVEAYLEVEMVEFSWPASYTHGSSEQYTADLQLPGREVWLLGTVVGIWYARSPLLPSWDWVPNRTLWFGRDPLSWGFFWGDRASYWFFASFWLCVNLGEGRRSDIKHDSCKKLATKGATNEDEKDITTLFRLWLFLRHVVLRNSMLSPNS